VVAHFAHRTFIVFWENWLMANNNAPFGLKPINLDGSTWAGQGKLIYIPSSQGTAIFVGDPLIPLGTTDAFGVPAFGLATGGATNRIAGAFLGNANGPAGSGVTMLQSSTVYHPASTAGYGFVTDSADIAFSIQEDSVGGAIAVTTGGYANGNLIAGTGSTVTGLSGWLLDSSTVATGNATYQVKVLGLTRGPDNAIGNYARWNVQLNLSALAQNTAGF
jgi:hypothetical protein